MEEELKAIREQLRAEINTDQPLVYWQQRCVFAETAVDSTKLALEDAKKRVRRLQYESDLWRERYVFAECQLRKYQNQEDEQRKQQQQYTPTPSTSTECRPTGNAG